MKIQIPIAIKMDSIVNIITTLFVFVLVLDPADVLFLLKLPLFVLLLILCTIAYKQINTIGITSLLIIYGICITTSLIGFFRDTSISPSFAIGIYKGFIMFFLILYASKLRVLEKLYFPIFLSAIVVTVIYVSTFFFPAIEVFMYGLTQNENSPIPIMISRRMFVGVTFNTVFYKTSPLAILVAGIFLYKLFNHEKKFWLNLTMSVSALGLLFIGGTRMNMLTALAILGSVIIQRLWMSSKGKIVAILCSFFGSLLMGIILLMFIGDKGEQSLEVKAVLSKAFYNEVDKDPSMLIFGQGPGATFDSLGIRGSRAVQSELTYQDLIRWFGFPLMIIIMLIYIYPIWIICKKRSKLKYATVLSVAYILYLIVAGTNPLLITSTGLLAMLVMYSYAFNPYYEKSE